MNETSSAYDIEAAAALKARRARDEAFYARLDAASKPFGTKEVLLSVGAGFLFLAVCFGIAVMLNLLTR